MSNEKYIIKDTIVNDVPIKTELTILVLVTHKPGNKENLQSIGKEILSKYAKSTDYEYHKHPTDIYIYLYTHENKMVDLSSWIGCLISSEYEKIPKMQFNQSQFNALKEVKQDKFGLNYETRQSIWREGFDIEYKAQKHADQKYPITPKAKNEEIQMNCSYILELRKKYTSQLCKKYSITIDILQQIQNEGVYNGWCIY